MSGSFAAEAKRPHPSSSLPGLALPSSAGLQDGVQDAPAGQASDPRERRLVRTVLLASTCLCVASGRRVRTSFWARTLLGAVGESHRQRRRVGQSRRPSRGRTRGFLSSCRGPGRDEVLGIHCEPDQEILTSEWHWVGSPLPSPGSTYKGQDWDLKILSSSIFCDSDARTDGNSNSVWDDFLE